MVSSASAVMSEVIRLAARSSAAHVSDRELLRRFAQGDEAAFGVLFRRHAGMVFGVCRRAVATTQDAEDACQAVFLLLAQKAARTCWQPSAANWLYTTARKVARNARIAAERRTRREAKAAVPESVRVDDPLTARELLAALDEELGRLPDIYREPLVLCCLEGLTRDEAAQRLGVPTATLKSHLERGRKRLGEALKRRGVELGAGLLAIAASRAGACSPQLLKSVLQAATGSSLPAVAGLVATHSLKMKLFGLTALVVGTVVAVVGAQGRPSAAPTDEKSMPAAKTAAAPKPAAVEGERKIVGRVLAPDGKPLAGAKLYYLSFQSAPKELGTSQRDGSFSVVTPGGDRNSHLLAKADGFGCDFVALRDLPKDGSADLRLVKDQVVRGRVIDTQGRPAARVTVRVRSLGAYANDSIDPFLDVWKKRDSWSGIPGGVKHLWDATGNLFVAHTDADGRFSISGLGAERLTSLRITDGGIADQELWVVTRAGFDPKPYNQATLDNIAKEMTRFVHPTLLDGPDVAVVAEPEKPIRGVVRFADTGKGKAGVEVWLTRTVDDLLPVPVKATTDADGRFVMHGARKAKAYMLEVMGDADAGTMPRQFRAADTEGYEPIVADFKVAKGVIIKGRVLDKSTGKGVPGLVMVDVLRNNPFAKDYPEFNSGSSMPLRQTSEDGSFKVVGIPGHILLMGGPDPRGIPSAVNPRMVYQPSTPDADFPEYFEKESGHVSEYLSLQGYSILQGNWCKVLNIKPGTVEVQQDIVLAPTAVARLKLQDGEGRAINGAFATGVSSENWLGPIHCATDVCPVYHLQPGKSRLLVLLEPKRKLTGMFSLSGDDKPPVAVKLTAAAALKGRIVDADGKPLADVVVDLNYRDREAAELHHNVAYKDKQIATDAAGNFALDTVLPGLKFEVEFHRGKRTFHAAVKPTDPTVMLRSGETRDLGAIELRPDRGPDDQ